MTTRKFEFSEGTSNKFWTIALDGQSHTVHFGRIGTVGQVQTAEFGSEADAQKSFAKLIAEKLKKGYVEKQSDGDTNAISPSVRKPKSAAAPVQQPPEVPHADAPSPANAARASAPTSSSVAGGNRLPGTASANPYTVRREIDLDIADFSYVSSRRAADEPLAPAAPFDLEDCLTRMRTKVRVQRYGWDWDFSRAIPHRMLAPEEAEFWLMVMTVERKHGTEPDALAKYLSKRTFTGQLPQPLRLESRYLAPQAAQCLAALVPAEELCELLLDAKTRLGAEVWQHNGPSLRAGFRLYVLPYLDEAAIIKCRAAAQARWDASAWPSGFYEAPAPFFYVGAMLGLHDEVHALVRQWPDDLYINSSWDHTHYHRPQEVVCGAGSAEQVADHFRRLKLPTNQAGDIATFLAVTNLSALDVVANTIATRSSKDEAEQLFGAFARIHAPEAAPHALGLMLNSKAPRLAREWLENNLDEAIVGLLPVAAGTGKLADAAAEFLNSVKRRGRAERIAAHLETVEPDVRARVREKTLDAVDVELPLISAEAIPSWWTQALTQAPVKKSKPIAWALPADLPPIVIGTSALGPDHITQLLGALQASTLESPHPLLRPLREHAAADRLDAFGWKLFENWLTEGAPSKEKWAFLAAGWLGGDRTVVKLAPLVREWPGESQHQRAVLGLEVLRTIGTDTALMQINGIAQKVKFKGLKERAVQCMDAIASSRHMTRAQLEDRIVPDCGLDERGERSFDFGSRQFRFVLGGELKPMIRYPDGALKTDLPKPNSKDQAAVAEAAVAEWKLLKKQIADVAKIQAVRLEQAMVTGRRWSRDEFDKLLVHHPLLVHLVRRLVWAAYADDGQLLSTFRVTEDQTLADSSDEPFTLEPHASVGVLHPLQLARQPHVLERWGQLFGDYEIVAPFAQLGRPLYQLTPEQLRQRAITHFESRGKLAAQTLVFGLEKLGWQRGVPADAGWVGEHSKQFYGAQITAVIAYEEGFSVGYWEGAGEQTIKSIIFLRGLYTPQMYPDHKGALPLAEVNSIALSEVLGDCELLLAKAK